MEQTDEKGSQIVGQDTDDNMKRYIVNKLTSGKFSEINLYDMKWAFATLHTIMLSDNIKALEFMKKYHHLLYGQFWVFYINSYTGRDTACSRFLVENEPDLSFLED